MSNDTIIQGLEQRVKNLLGNEQDVFLVDHGSLYLALQRIEERGWIDAEWGTSENNRRARFYRLTTAGRKQLKTKTAEWNRIAEAMGHILSAGEAKA